jgi:hypothetical protein
MSGMGKTRNRAFLAVAPLLMPAIASAQVLTSLDPAKVCVPGLDGTYRVPAGTVVGAMLKDAKVPLEVEDLGPAPRPLGERVLAAGPCAKTSGCSELQNLFNLAYEIVYKRQDHGFTLVWTGAGPEPKDEAEQLRLLLNPRSEAYELRCASAPPTQPANTSASSPARSGESRWKDFVVGADIDQAEKSFKQRKPATFSIKSDQVKASSNYSFSGAIVWKDILGRSPSDSAEDIRAGWFRPLVSPFVSLERESNKDPAKAVDDLAFGARIEGRLTRAVPFYLTGSWVTDISRFDSSMTKIEFRVRPPLDALPAYGRYLHGVREDRFTVLPVWRAYVVADYANVADPGRKASLLDVPQYERVGFDLDAALRFGRGVDDPSVILSATYKLRDEWRDHRPGDAEWLDIGLDFKPSDASSFSFGVSYEKGRVTDTLEKTDLLKASIGFRR